MSAAEEKIILSRIRAGLAWLTPLLFLLAALIALASGLVGPSSVSAKTHCTPQDRVWGNSGSAIRFEFRNTICSANKEHLTLIDQMQWQATTKTHKTSGSAGGATAIPAPHAGIPSTFQQLVIYPIHPTVSHFGRDPPVRFRRTIRYDRSARYGVASGVFIAAKSTADTVVRFGPHMEGPLPEGISSTFRGGSYSQTTLGSDTTLYRVYGGEAAPLRSWWSRTPPAGPLQSQMDLALPPENTAQNVVMIRVPTGTVIYEGAAEGNFGRLGGGSQVYIPRVNPAWVVQP